jgi:hypothetical protein
MMMLPDASLLLTAYVCCAALLLLVPSETTVRASTPRAGDATQATEFMGDAACLPCHKAQSVSYNSTAHHLTSQMAEKKSILGPFAEGSNVLSISVPAKTSEDPRLYFKMEAKDDGFFQTAVAELGEKRLVRSERFDIAFGSGVRGQTYLYWSDNQLFELPVSYWTDEHRWINSPGYRDGTANFANHVDPPCMECHATYIQALSTAPQTNVYEKASFVPGISCETCHGSGAGHVAQETARTRHESFVQGSLILNPAHFARDRQVDQCALCHNGTQREELMPAFSYIPGEPLDKYLGANLLDIADKPDVHGNQVGLLKRSRCYLSSPAMSCSTCHEVHAPERDAASYSSRCLSCHTWQSCGASKTLGRRIAQNCIDCHMPLQQTQAIVSLTAGRTIRTSIRSHWIKVYPETGPHGASRM